MNKPYTLSLRFRDKDEPVSAERERAAKLRQIKKQNKLESLNKAVIHAIMSYPQENK